MSEPFRRGKIWYGFVWENGKRRMRSTHCTDKAAAEKVFRELQRAAADPDHARAQTGTVTAAVQLLLSTREEQATAGRRSTETVEFYRKKSGHLIRILEGVPDDGTYTPFPLHTLRAHHVDAYISRRRAEKVGENTISKELVTLRAALKLAKRAGLWKGDLGEIMPVAFSPEYKPRERWLPVDEVQKLLPHLRADCAARVALILATSACASESDHVLREDVDQETGRVLLRGTKRPTRWRTVPIVTTWQKSLLAYSVKFAEGTDGRLFGPWGNIRRDLSAACKAAQIAPCSPNDLRRTHSHWLRAEGVPLELVAPMMGHASTRMVQTVYGKLSADELAARLCGVIPGAADCNAGATERKDPGGLGGPPGGAKKHKNRSKNRGFAVPRDGIEPPTRGFSIPCSTN